MKNRLQTICKFVYILFALIGMCGTAISATVEIKNNLAPIQIGATIYDNGGKPGNPTINIWAPDTSGSGTTVSYNAAYIYPNAMNNGSSAIFGVQVNAARIPTDGGQCDQLCNHIQVNISQDGQTCAAANVSSGSCGANQNAPHWQAKFLTTMVNNVCTITLTQAKTPPIVCSCEYGAYPCNNSVQCGPGSSDPTCPVQPPYHWQQKIVVSEM